MIPDAVSWKPLFIVLEFGFHLLKVNKEVVAFCVVLAEVKLHPGVVARLKAGLIGFLVIVKVLVEVGYLLVC